MHYRTQAAAAEDVVAGLAPPQEGSHLRAGADLADPEQLAAVFETVRREWGGLDCLVNNAGIWRANPIAALDAAELEEMLRVNLQAVFLCTPIHLN